LIKVLIVDDHAIVRDGIRQLIESQEDMLIVGEAGDGVTALKHVKNQSPDVVLLDIGMPGMTGLETISLVKEARPEVKVVILTMHSKDSYVHQALNAGAMGFILKASSSRDILTAIRAAQKDEYFLSSKIRAGVVESYLRSRKHKPSVRGYDLLTEREQQVFRKVVEGSTTKEIAGILCLSSKTIEKHRTSIHNKLGVHGRLELLKYAIKIGVVDPDLWET
jgi:two-component system response regulator NreC